ncbi:MAG: hypothetical protein JKY71_06125, partial [Alphaproteobacteria bacterium]|nr:hypothetical protein [Alphaproteobacteria bacterium]
MADKKKQAQQSKADAQASSPVGQAGAGETKPPKPIYGEQVEHDLCTEPRCSDTEPRVPGAIGDAPAASRPVERDELGGHVDRTTPLVREPDAGQLRERAVEVISESLKGLGALILRRSDAP